MKDEGWWNKRKRTRSLLHPSSFILYPSSLSSSLWLTGCAFAGLAMAFLFDDSCQLDGGMHYLFARWAWKHLELFVGVWSRPSYTLLYSIPALAGYRIARIFTVLICLAIGWQTWRMAADMKLERAPLAIAFVWLQPSFFLFCADNMTEPVFALTFIIALRLHHRGSVRTGMLVASLLILSRPEGLFLGLLWGIWVIAGRGFKSIIDLPLLAAGSFIWWAVAWLITGDPLFIKNNWPPNWPMTGTIYGAAGLLAYPIRLPEIAGLFLVVPFLYGLYISIKRREYFILSSTFLLIFILHTILRAYGLLGSAGYPRYMIAISPAIAIITLIGWNRISNFFSHLPGKIRFCTAVVIIALSAFVNVLYVDGAEWSRDAHAIGTAHRWYKNNPQPITRLIWSQPYACILFEGDPWENPVFTDNRDENLELLRNSPRGTMVVWDSRVGPKSKGLKVDDIEKAGYVRLYSQSFLLEGYILNRSWFGYGGPRYQEIYLLYK
jgi:hypothetical protein